MTTALKRIYLQKIQFWYFLTEFGTAVLLLVNSDFFKCFFWNLFLKIKSFCKWGLFTSWRIKGFLELFVGPFWVGKSFWQHLYFLNKLFTREKYKNSVNSIFKANYFIILNSRICFFFFSEEAFNTLITLLQVIPNKSVKIIPCKSSLNLFSLFITKTNLYIFPDSYNP